MKGRAREIKNSKRPEKKKGGAQKMQMLGGGKENGNTKRRRGCRCGCACAHVQCGGETRQSFKEPRCTVLGTRHRRSLHGYGVHGHMDMRVHGVNGYKCFFPSPGTEYLGYLWY